jgi:NAD(P)-dependent dehydrogenase (short-subunit alcohol dehydrogenase family)
MTLPFFGAYNATKHALESMSDALRYELAPFGIDVVLIEPGIIRTEFTPRAMDELTKFKDPTSPYAPVLARADEMRVQAEKTAVGPECVARAIEIAVETRRPRARYVTPFRARVMLAFVALMPTRWTDAILRAIAGLTRRRLSSRRVDPTVRPRALAT